MTNQFEQAQQLLPREAYLSQQWFEREQRTLFDSAWVWAGLECDLASCGDFITARFAHHTVFVVRATDGSLQAFHNICRHRGCEVLEGSGNTGTHVRCPYHRWTYELDGNLRAVPNQQECFGELDTTGLSLHRASTGVYRGMVFVNPDPNPPLRFESWLANMDDHGWPHQFDDGSLEYIGEVTYEMQCNWKVFYENAVDGYHLGYLHDQTLGKLYPDANLWAPVGQNTVWYSTERDGEPLSSSVLSEQLAQASGAARMAGHDTPGYPGVVMLFPLTILSPNPWGMYVSILEPQSPERTLMRTLAWAPAGSAGRIDISAAPQLIRLRDLDVHPLDSGNFQIEDMWIVEKIQRSLHSPRFEIGPLANGAGAESPITHFQRSILEALGPTPR